MQNLRSYYETCNEFLFGKQASPSPEVLIWQGFEVRIERRPRLQRMILKVHPFEPFRVIVNFSATLAMIHQFLEASEDWIHRRMKRWDGFVPPRERLGREGDEYMVGGKFFPLKYSVTPGGRSFVALSGERLLYLRSEKDVFIIQQEKPSGRFNFPASTARIGDEAVGPAAGAGAAGAASVAGSTVAVPHQSRVSHKLKGTIHPLTLMDPLKIHQSVVKFLDNKAEQLLSERTHHWSQVMNLQPSRLRFTRASTRWGSCNSRGVIALNRRLVGAPLEVMDSVVVHELAHLVHLNHSKDFWKLVRTHIPNLDDCDRWLRRHTFAL